MSLNPILVNMFDSRMRIYEYQAWVLTGNRGRSVDWNSAWLGLLWHRVMIHGYDWAKGR